jgi:predicted neuraminidase
MGGTLYINSEVENVYCKLSAKSNSEDNIKEIRLIKNGQILMSWNPNSTSFNSKFILQISSSDFYRIEVDCGSGYAFSNPIWVSQNLISQNSSLKLNDNLSSNEMSITSNNLTIHPNPANSKFQILGLSTGLTYHYSIKTLQGKIVKSGLVSEINSSINLNDINADIYILHINPESDNSAIKRMLVIVKKD